MFTAISICTPISDFIAKDAWQLTWEMLTALRHLHLRRIVHCDLKPENILCHEHHGTLKLKLADWGFAQVFSAIFFIFFGSGLIFFFIK
jgi:serine/threonine protein kinase